MVCEFEYCIYNMDGQCGVARIGVNALGMCETCITVALEEAFLNEAKRAQLEAIEKRWAERGGGLADDIRPYD